MKKMFGKILAFGVAFAIATIAASCGGMTEKTINGSDGVSAVASSSWQLIVGEKELGELYDTSDVDVTDIKMALGKDSGREGYLIVEEVYPQQTLQELKDYINEYANKPDQLNTAIEEMKSFYLTDREIEQITPIIKGETLTAEQENYLDQELILQGYLYNLSKDSALALTMNGIKDLTLNGQKVQFADYTYSNAQYSKIRQLDGYAKVGERIYLISVWENQDEYDKNSEDYEKVLQSITIKPETTTVTTTG